MGVCPILMRELLSNLAKAGSDRVETERRLAALAAEVDMPGFHVVVDARSMAASNLMGDPNGGRCADGWKSPYAWRRYCTRKRWN